MYFGVPAIPMADVMADAIGQVVAQVRGIREAYLPQCSIEGDTEARQVLVVEVGNDQRIPEIMQDLMWRMKLLLPPGVFIDILPYASSAMPPAARVETCRIFRAARKSWWERWFANRPRDCLRHRRKLSDRRSMLTPPRTDVQPPLWPCICRVMDLQSPPR